MQPLDKHNLFSIFEQGDEEVYIEHGVEEILQNPYVLLGMVIRGLENFQLMDLMYKRNFPKEYGNIQKSLQYKYYCKLYQYLDRIDSNNFDTKHSIGESFDVDSVNFGLNTLRVYFESIEEYEKCGVIKKYLDLLG
jgi:hypothetical protein